LAVYELRLAARLVFGLALLILVALDAAHPDWLFALTTCALVAASVGLTKWMFPPLQTDGAYETLDFWTFAFVVNLTYFVAYNDSTASLLVLTLAAVMFALTVVISFGGGVTQRGWAEGAKRFFITFLASLLLALPLSACTVFFARPGFGSLLMTALVVMAVAAQVIDPAPNIIKLKSLSLAKWAVALVAGLMFAFVLVRPELPSLGLGLVAGAISSLGSFFLLRRYAHTELDHFKGMPRLLVWELAPLGAGTVIAALLAVLAGFIL
jgi:hypothetical protein